MSKPELMAWFQADAQQAVGNLTRTERDILVFLSKGLSVHEVSEHMRANAVTVASYRTIIYRKLDVHSIAEAAVIACKAGLV
jgi:DNA-binding NarL/FixJ family response regulator